MSFKFKGYTYDPQKLGIVSWTGGEVQVICEKPLTDDEAFFRVAQVCYPAVNWVGVYQRMMMKAMDCGSPIELCTHDAPANQLELTYLHLDLTLEYRGHMQDYRMQCRHCKRTKIVVREAIEDMPTHVIELLFATAFSK